LKVDKLADIVSRHFPDTPLQKIIIAHIGRELDPHEFCELVEVVETLMHEQ
jgi:hypothetical protein